jgi:hypothetical protein
LGTAAWTEKNWLAEIFLPRPSPRVAASPSKLLNLSRSRFKAFLDSLVCPAPPRQHTTLIGLHSVQKFRGDEQSPTVIHSEMKLLQFEKRTDLKKEQDHMEEQFISEFLNVQQHILAFPFSEVSISAEGNHRS